MRQARRDPEPRRPARANHGPRAAAGNRRALLAAATEVFAERGFDAPLSSVARRAGVGQGSLYRHFPDRVSLALAVFEDNVAALEVLAAEPGTTFDRLLATITEQIIESVVFVDLLVAEDRDPRLDAVTDRVRTLLAASLKQARAAGTVRRSLRTDEVMVAVTMVAAFVAKSPAQERRGASDAAWRLLRRALRP